MAGDNSSRPTRQKSVPNPVSDLFLPGAPPITTKKQLQSKFSNLDLYDVFLAVIINHQSSAALVAKLSTRVDELEELVDDLREDMLDIKEKLKNSLEPQSRDLKEDMVDIKEKLKNSLEPQSRELDDRLLRQEAYSGRNTIIVAGLPEADSETPDSLEENLVELLKNSDPTITKKDLGIAHRNGKTKKPGQPGRSITCVLTRASKKDMLMRKESRSNLKDNHKVMIFHRLSDALRRRKKELEDLNCVKWVAFSGHRLFTVCVKGKEEGKDNFIKNVLRTEDVTEQS